MENLVLDERAYSAGEGPIVFRQEISQLFHSQFLLLFVWVSRLKVHGERLIVAGQQVGQLLKECLFHGQFLHFLVIWFGFLCISLGCSYPNTALRKKEKTKRPQTLNLPRTRLPLFQSKQLPRQRRQKNLQKTLRQSIRRKKFTDRNPNRSTKALINALIDALINTLLKTTKTGFTSGFFMIDFYNKSFNPWSKRPESIILYFPPSKLTLFFLYLFEAEWRSFLRIFSVLIHWSSNWSSPLPVFLTWTTNFSGLSSVNSTRKMRREQTGSRLKSDGNHGIKVVRQMQLQSFLFSWIQIQILELLRYRMAAAEQIQEPTCHISWRSDSFRHSPSFQKEDVR